jgi:hypothetical protein
MNLPILVADEAWLATALLHRENPGAEDFSLDEIRDKAFSEFRDRRPGVWQHIVSHCVASNAPNPAQYRMLHSTGRGRRRLYRNGDTVHPERHGKSYPSKRDLPEQYRPLVDWYLTEYNRKGESSGGSSSPAIMLGFVGLIPAYDLQKMSEAIASACERVDSSEW